MAKLNQESSDTPKRFVILRHTFPDGGSGEFFDHFDLMLEQESKLATWQLKTLPEPDEAVSVKKLADHRMRYLNYEGPISDDRGSVERIMEGTYVVCHKDDGCLEVLLTQTPEVLLTQTPEVLLTQTSEVRGALTSQAKSMRLKIVFGASKAATAFRI